MRGPVCRRKGDELGLGRGGGIEVRLSQLLVSYLGRYSKYDVESRLFSSKNLFLTLVSKFIKSWLLYEYWGFIKCRKLILAFYLMS